MKKINMLMYGILVLVIGALIYSIFEFTKDSSITGGNIINTNGKSSTSNKQTFESVWTGSTGPGDVSIELTPKGINNNKFTFDIAFNTHSVDLSQFDLKSITTLEYKWKVFKPIEAPSLGGHHSFGSLVFDVDENVNTFIVKIIGIPKVEERIFKWE